MRVKATVLVDNYAYGINGVIAQHGWAVFLETERGNFLFDTGAGKTVLNNAIVLGVDLASIEGIILSHHHHDHTGGLLEVLEYLKRPVDVHAHPDLFKDSYSTRHGKISYSGMPFRQAVLEAKGARFKLGREFRSVVPGLYLTGEVPRLTAYETGDPDLVINGENGPVQDPLADDLSVVIPTDRGLFIVLGCAHAGIINTLNHAMKVMGQERIQTVFGGTHLGPANEVQREESIRSLLRMNIARLGASHCTGLNTAARLAYEFGQRFVFCGVGTVFEA